MTASITTAPHLGLINARRRFAATVVRAVNVVVVAVLAMAMAGGAAAVFWFHLAVHPVLTGSMRPTFGPGWMVITRPIAVSHVRVGQVLLFKPPGSNASFTHRVINVSGTQVHPIIQTKGDANPVADPWKAQLNGPKAYEVVAEVPKLGWLLAGRAQIWIRALLIGIGGLVLTVGGVGSILRGSPSRGRSARHRSTSRRRDAVTFPTPSS